MGSSLLSLGRALVATAFFMVASTGTGFAQCPVDDANTTNNDCASAAPAVTGTLSVQDLTEDWWTFVVNAGDTITIDVNLLASTGDLDLDLFDDTGNCGSVVDGSGTIGALESVTYDNTSAGPITLTLRVYLFAGLCRDYDMVATTMPLQPNTCTTTPDDGEEENDDCSSSVVPSANPLTALFVSKTDEDWYSFTLQDGEVLNLDVPHINLNGDVDAELYAADCTTVLDISETVDDTETLAWKNSSGVAATVHARIFVWANGDLDCNSDYGLAWSIVPDPCTIAVDDMFEENDDCASAATITPGFYTGLLTRLQTQDSDWYTLSLADGDTLTVDAFFPVAEGDVDMNLEDACNGFLLAEADSTNDDESLTYTNMTGAAQAVFLEVFVWQGSAVECNFYDLMIDDSGVGPGNVVPYCFGDGSGTNCPCGNNSTAGHPGGCGNSAGDGGILTATGVASVAADSLNLDLTSATPTAFALLVSADNQLPQTGCVGCGNPVFDGLRCAGGNFLRHGPRATNLMGETGLGWGPPGNPPGGLIATSGFTPGQTRHFFTFYREDVMASCMTGQNSSNGISITFLP